MNDEMTVSDGSSRKWLQTVLLILPVVCALAGGGVASDADHYAGYGPISGGLFIAGAICLHALATMHARRNG